MKLNKVDLNLFIVFDVIYSERNITRSAQVLNLTQPTISNSLARLRKTLNDELFVRTPQGMVPTPLADNIIGRVREALQILDISVREGDSFEPSSSSRRFRLSMNDLAEALLLPTLMSDLCLTAPEISLESYYTNRPALSNALASGELDFAIEAPLLTNPNLCQTPLLKEPYVCVVRHNHPLLKAEVLTLEQYLQLGHIHISSRRRGLGHVDMALNNMGYQRRVLLRVQHYLMAPELVQRTDLALTIPQRWANQFDLKTLQLPFDVPPLDWHLFWHKSADGDQANQWLRKQILELATTTA